MGCVFQISVKPGYAGSSWTEKRKTELCFFWQVEHDFIFARDWENF